MIAVASVLVSAVSAISTDRSVACVIRVTSGYITEELVARVIGSLQAAHAHAPSLILLHSGVLATCLATPHVRTCARSDALLSTHAYTRGNSY